MITNNNPIFAELLAKFKDSPLSLNDGNMLILELIATLVDEVGKLQTRIAELEKRPDCGFVPP